MAIRQIKTFTSVPVVPKNATMLTSCLWTTLPWMVLGQTYYMSFIFNNYGTSRISAPQLGFNGTAREPIEGGNLKISSEEHSGEGDTLEVSSLEHSRETKHNSKKDKAMETLELSSEDHSRKKIEAKKPSVEDKDSRDSGETMTTRSTTTQIKSTTKRKTKATTYETPEMANEITTESTMTTAIDKEKPTVEIYTESPKDKFTDPPGIGKEPPDSNTPGFSVRSWDSVTPHPSAFFDYPEATCSEDMDLHEVFGIRLERDRGLPTKILCTFKNRWGGPWLLMTRIELPVRVHMRHWFLGYLTADYKDMNINFLALAHIMNSMRTAMLILGQDKDNKLVYNLYDDVVISAFNDLFMMRKAELVEANTTELLFVSVGKVLSSYAGRNRSCPLQVLGSWWGHHSVQDMYQGFFCIFPKDRIITKPGYVAIFIKPSLFPANNTALYDHPISTRRPWSNSNYNTKILNETEKNSKAYKKEQQLEWERNKMAVQKELDRRARIFEAIDRLRMEEAQRHRGR
ncbi:uncharacterized protein LOC6612106 [Drosophila sechellia]|uniref:uncharacterized protein LOC6612106 n=1 Tax=Drosophila sechellia TaxID=7238 RepID=UPI0013DDCE0C|nr:uncharacterized protein LOC6612106 [Drosophila sechellia]